MNEGNKPVEERFKADGLSRSTAFALILGTMDAEIAGELAHLLEHDKLIFAQLAEPIALMCEKGFDAVAATYGHRNAIETTKFLATHAVASLAIRHAKGGGQDNETN